MQIIIEDNRTIRLAQVFDEQEKIINNRFKVKDPSAYRKRSMKNGNWDGYYYFYKPKSQTMRKGFLKDLIELCLEKNIPFEITDLRNKSKYPIPSANSFDNELISGIVAHKHQMRCWKSVCASSRHPMFEIGTHFHPTGGGKSAMMAGIVKLLRCPTLIITEQTIVLNQITKALKIFNAVHHDDIGEFYSGKMPSGNLVCIGSISSLQFPKKPKFSGFNIKLSTVNKDFLNMYNNNRDKLSSIISEQGILAWLRSSIIDKIQTKMTKRKIDEKYLSLLPDDYKKWTDKTTDFVYKKIDELYNKDLSKLSEIIGSDDVDIWRNTTVISSIYSDELSKALVRFYEFEKNKYFEVALKSYHTLVKKFRELENMVKECELLLVDEMDNAASKNYDRLFEKMYCGRYIYGFSGTPYDLDKPVQKMVLESRFGPVISRSTRKELEKIGQIQPVEYYMIQFGDIDPNDKTVLDVAERNIIIDNNKFHDKILKIINTWPEEKSLIVIDTTNIEDLGLTLQEKIPNSVFLYNKVSNKKRKEAIENFELGNIKVLIVGKVGKRGMDLGGGAHNEIIIGGGKLRSNFDQIIGRGVRKNDRGYSRVFDFYFTGNKYLLKHSRKRLKFIVDMGYKANVLVKNKSIEADKFIKSRYRLPK